MFTSLALVKVILSGLLEGRRSTVDTDIRVIILTRAGKALCAGFDLKELGASGVVTAADSADNVVARAMEAVDGPIIGAVMATVSLGALKSRRPVSS